ncbi:MAG: heparinase II/III family protein [Proteobacteria bacterium]|nr:heparinase II/III family protein [Pseudomonadota bacterium]MBU1740636.1 heparinase II/III family protein [Pseudomonadota bacterium]
MYRAATTPFAAWWNLRWRQNHLWINYAALGLAGLVLSGEAPEASHWVRAALAAFHHVNVYLPRDGSYHEGIGYWRYAVEHLSVFFMALEMATDVDPWPSFPWLNQSVRFRLHHMFPTRGGMINFGDTPEVEETSAHAQLFIIARAFKNPVAQWLAREIEYATRQNPEDTGRLWAILGYDPRVKAVPPDDRPTFALFDDLGLFLIRSDWGPDAILVAFKCGPPGGRRNTWMRISGLGVNLSHSHPDQNSLIIFARGRPVLVDDGYARYKATRHHNTLLVGGLGQRGEGGKWYDENRPRRSILTRLRPVLATPFISAARGEAAPMYPTAAGLKHFGRLLVFLPPDLVLVADDVAARRPVDLELMFHFRGRLSRTGAGDRFLLQDETGRKLLSARFVSPRKLVARIRPHTRPLFGLRQAAVSVQRLEHATLSLGPAARTGTFRMLSILKPWTSDRRIIDLKAVTTAGAFGAAFIEAGRRNVFLTRTGPGTMTHGPFRADARTMFVAQDRAGNLVALVLAGRELSCKRESVLLADRPVDAALMRRSQVLVVLARSARAAKLTLRTGFKPVRVQVGGRNLPSQPGWSRGEITIDLAPGRPAVIVAVGPRAPALPGALAAEGRADFFLAR